MQPPAPGTNHETATAHSHAYEFIGRLYLAGLTAKLLPFVEAIPMLAAARLDPFDSEREAADHQHLFGFNVFAHESIFLDQHSMLSGPVTEAVVATYQQAGFLPTLRDVPADHVGHELGLLAFLCGAEADAWEDDETGQAQRMRTMQRSFLDDHLLRWLPALAQGIRQQQEPFYAALVELTLDLVVEHRNSLGEEPLAGPAAFLLPPSPPLLGQEEVRPRQLAAFLLTPAYSGLYLSRDDIARLGQRFSLPRGFGERRQMLTNLLKSAVRYDSLHPLLAAFRDMVHWWQRSYELLCSSGPAFVSGFVTPWFERLALTLKLLEQLESINLPADETVDD